jgi:hypothetical protein
VAGGSIKEEEEGKLAPNMQMKNFCGMFSRNSAYYNEKPPGILSSI